MRVGGIDQCNKGQCLGPIFVVSCYGDFKDVRDYRSIPYVGESKTTRNLPLTSVLKELNLKYAVVTIGVDLIDRFNINTLIHHAQKRLINKVKLDLAYVDNHQINNHHSHNVVCAHKMDQVQPLTGLASIIAVKLKNRWKTKMKAKYGQDLGSGNLTDPVTKAYIKRNHPNVRFLRKKWSLRSINL